MSIPSQYGYTDPTWYDRRQPTLEDFQGDEEAYQAALDDYVAAINGPQVDFGMPEQEVYNHQTGQYEMRGGTPDRFEGVSEAEFAANQLNSRFSNLAKFQESGRMTPQRRQQSLLALNSRAQVRPDEMQLAYNAMREDGTPVLPDPVLAYLEALGFGPTGDYNWEPPVEDAVGDDGFLPSPFGPEDTWTVQPDGTMVNGNGDVFDPRGDALLPNSVVPPDDRFVNDVLGTASALGVDEIGMRRLEAMARGGQMTPDDWERALIAYNQAVADGVDPNVAIVAILYGGY